MRSSLKAAGGRTATLSCLLILITVLPADRTVGAPGEAGREPGKATATTEEPAAAPDDATRERVEKIVAAVLAPALSARDASAPVRAGGEDRANYLRMLWEKLEEELAEIRNLDDRRRHLAAIENRFADLLVAAIPGPGAEAVAREGIAAARRDSRLRRRLRLFETIKNWCPNENWTLTLADCSKDKSCAEPQKRMITEWLELGMTDVEIREKMVKEAGSDKVLVVPRGKYAFMAPIAVTLIGALLVVLLFWGLRRGARSASPESSAEQASPVTVADGSDDDVGPDWDARIERELREIG